jgi:peptide/nickel transport system permease protein
MANGVLIRIGHAILSLLVLMLLVFAMLRLTGDPVYFAVPVYATPAQKDLARQELGLDKPLPIQFAVYVEHILVGDMGISFKSRLPVTQLILQRLPNTLILGAAALLLTIAIGVPLGIYSAYRRGGVFDRVTRFIAALGQSTPSFWLGLILILVFAVDLHVLPSGGTGGLQNLILPSITLSVAAMAGLARLLRSNMLDVLGSDYILFERIKGVPERQILWKHGLRNAGLTTLSFVGILTARLFTGAVLVETVFIWPGMGRLMIEAIQDRDFNVVQGVILVFGLAYVGVNLLVDVLYMVLNPRLR